MVWIFVGSTLIVKIVESRQQWTTRPPEAYFPTSYGLIAVAIGLIALLKPIEPNHRL